MIPQWHAFFLGYGYVRNLAELRSTTKVFFY